MGLIQAKVELINTVDASNAHTGLIAKEKVRRMEAQLLVDSVATMLCINENIALELGLTQAREGMITLADGSKKACKIVGPVTIRFLTRTTVVEAVVLPGDAQPLLGAEADRKVQKVQLFSWGGTNGFYSRTLRSDFLVSLEWMLLLTH